MARAVVVQGLDQLTQLLKIFDNKEAYGARIKELRDAVAEANAALEQELEGKSLAEAKAKLEAQRQAVSQFAADARAEADRIRQEAQADVLELQAAQKQLAQDQAELARQSEALNVREADLGKRTGALERLEAGAQAQMDRGRELEAEFAEKLAAIKKITG